MTSFTTPHLTLRPRQDTDIATLSTLLPEVELDVGGPGVRHEWVAERDGTVVGFAYLRSSGDLPDGALEAGCHLAPAHRGAGLGGEMGRAVVDHAFHHLGASAVFVVVPAGDVGARRFAERVGFIGVGERSGGEQRVLVLLPETGAGVHHVELWVSDLPEAERSWGWLLTELGWGEYQRWPHGVSWRRGSSYIVVEDSPARMGEQHDRMRPGLNHLAVHVRTRTELDRIAAEATEHGWRLMFADRHPHAGGPDHYAAYLENAAGFEVELVANDHRM